jgi:hypothetical protein
MDFSKKLKAIELRKNGLSYREIQKTIRASKSTLSLWLKDIELSKAQKSRLTRLQATAYSGAKKIQAQSSKHHNEIRAHAEQEVTKLINNSFFVAGLMLYWAEGSKSFGSVQFSNSDPNMIKIMMRWFREFCAVPEAKFRIGLFIHSLHIHNNYLGYWQKVTSIPLTQFQKPYIKATIFSNRKNKLYNGTCVIKIHSRELLSKILGWKNGIEKIFLHKSKLSLKTITYV